MKLIKDLVLLLHVFPNVHVNSDSLGKYQLIVMQVLYSFNATSSMTIVIIILMCIYSYIPYGVYNGGTVSWIQLSYLVFNHFVVNGGPQLHELFPLK